MKRNSLFQISTLLLVVLFAGACASTENASMDSSADSMMAEEAPAVAELTAKDIVRSNIDATGGMEAWQAVEDMHSEAEIGIEIPNLGALKIKLETFNIFPGYGFTNVEAIEAPAAIPAEQINQKAYFSPLKGWMEQGGTRTDMKDLPEQVKQQFMRSTPKNELDFLTLDDSLVVRLDDRMMNDKNTYTISVTTGGATNTYLYDAESYLLVAQESETPAGTAVTTVGDYMDVDGLMFAGTNDMNVSGQSQKITFTLIEINTGLTPNQVATKAGEMKRSAPE